MPTQEEHENWKRQMKANILNLQCKMLQDAIWAHLDQWLVSEIDRVEDIFMHPIRRDITIGMLNNTQIVITVKGMLKDRTLTGPGPQPLPSTVEEAKLSGLVEGLDFTVVDGVPTPITTD